MTDRIALLGWGSLLWDNRAEFDALHTPWAVDGPIIKLEFSRISSSRRGALTLVIDAEHGAPTTVAHCLSLRSDMREAMGDLQAREGTTFRHIGYLRRTGESRCRDRDTEVAVSA